MTPVIPASASPDVQNAFRAVWQALQAQSGTLNVDLHGRRMINAGGAVDAADYVTKADLETAVTAAASASSVQPSVVVAAPATSVGVAIANYYGTSATNFLGTPRAWLSLAGYKVAGY